MTHEFNSKGYNPKDFYLIINLETGEIYETFRIKSTASKFIKEHPFKGVLSIRDMDLAVK